MQALSRPYSQPIVSHLFSLFSSRLSSADIPRSFVGNAVSANPSLHSANADIISLISSFALAQEAYNSALERGETPPPPVLASKYQRSPLAHEHERPFL